MFAALSLVPHAPPVAPPPPPMPSAEEQERALHTRVRESILKDDWDDTAKAWRREHMDEEVERTLGPPDTSRNGLMDACKQLSTPGLYGTPPRLFHADVAAADLMAGLLADAGWSTKMQQVQYLTLGCGDYMVRPSATPDGLSLRLVSPGWVHVRADANRPDVPLGVWELRLRWIAGPMGGRAGGEWAWCWDVMDVGWDEYAQVAQPCYRVLRRNPRAQEDGQPLWLDLSPTFLDEPDAPMPEGGWVGENYPIMNGDKPMLGYVTYRANDSGEPWNTYHMRGAHRGTLNEALFWSYTGKAALSASGKAVVMIGAMLPTGTLRETSPQDNIVVPGQDEDGTVRSLALLPGSLMSVPKDPDFQGQPIIEEIGPGAELGMLLEFCTAYGLQQLTRWGLNPSDVTRVSNNPQSGAALYISAKGKREFSDRVRPMFSRSDERLIALCAVLAMGAGLADRLPTTGWTVEHARIPLSPQERADQRAEYEWQVERGHMSEVDAYMADHPGIDRQTAMMALVRARVEQAQLEVAVRDALAAAGFVENETPSTDGMRPEDDPGAEDDATSEEQ